MDCELKVSVYRTSGRTIKSGPVSSFLVDSSYYYSAVFKHVSTCKVCDPVRILQAYLFRRKKFDRFHGLTSAGLAQLAVKYERMVRKRGGHIPRELVAEFIKLSASGFCLRRYDSYLTLVEKVEALRVMHQHERKRSIAALMLVSREYSLIYHLAKNQEPIPQDEAEIRNLMEVAEVTHS